MTNIITTQELKKKLDSGVDFYLIDTLSEGSYRARHLPQAKSLPYAPDFVEQFAAKIKAPQDAEIIVYCASSTCQLSVLAAEALAKAGYTKVSHYKDGLAGWQDAGYKFEGEAA